MRLIKQCSIIFTISFFGEFLHEFIPLPIPASIYGLILMSLALHFRVVSFDSVKDTSLFLIEIMPLMFIPAAVGLITSWGMIRSRLLAYGVITVVSTFAVMIVSGQITQLVIRHGKRKAAEQ